MGTPRRFHRTKRNLTATAVLCLVAIGCGANKAAPAAAPLLISVVNHPSISQVAVGATPFDLWSLCGDASAQLIAHGSKNEAIGDCANRDVYEFTLTRDTANPAKTASPATASVTARLTRRQGGDVVAFTSDVQSITVPRAPRGSAADRDAGTGEGKGGGDEGGRGAAVPTIAVEHKGPLAPLVPTEVATWQPGKHPQAGAPLVRLLEHYKIDPKGVAAIELYGAGDAPVSVEPAKWGRDDATNWMAVKLNRHGMLRFVWMKEGRAGEKLKDVSRIVIVPRKAK